MPLDTELIDTGDAPPFEAGARFFARLAYPTPSERNLRDQFYSALVRWALLYRSEFDPTLKKPLLVRPMHFLADDTLHEETVKRGLTTLEERYFVARHVVMPILMAARKGRSVTLDGVPLNFGNLAADAMASLGWLVLVKLERCGDAMRYRRGDGQIGWTATPQLRSRLSDAELDALGDMEDLP